MNYEDQIRRKLVVWEKKLLRPPGFLEKASKKVSNKINNLIPAKIHATITAAVKAIVRTTLFGAEYTPKGKVQFGLSLAEADEKANDIISLYQKIAAAEGAGTGAGGIMLAAADFPAFIAIKIKFLFELAHAYGFNTAKFAERIFILSVFRLAFSDIAQRGTMLAEIKNWSAVELRWTSDSEYYKNFNWEDFQKDYRDSIDFRKMLQMIPGIGAVAGAWANYSIVEDLGEIAMNCYRLRILSKEI